MSKPGGPCWGECNSVLASLPPDADEEREPPVYENHLPTSHLEKGIHWSVADPASGNASSSANPQNASGLSSARPAAPWTHEFQL